MDQVDLQKNYEYGLKEPYNLEYFAFSQSGDELVSSAMAIFDNEKSWSVYRDPRWKISHNERVCQYEYKYKNYDRT